MTHSKNRLLQFLQERNQQQTSINHTLASAEQTNQDHKKNHNVNPSQTVENMLLLSTEEIHTVMQCTCKEESLGIPLLLVLQPLANVAHSANLLMQHFRHTLQSFHNSPP